MDKIETSIYAISETTRDNDFIGFTYGGIHSSNFGIKRTSEGSRFNDNLLPAMQDKTVQIPGADGMYYFGSYYNQRVFSVSYAFDCLTEEKLEEMREWLGDKKIKDLIFDETPYKVYRAKVTGTATIKHIPFSENGKRIYKGEGNIQFTCYYPFALVREDKMFLSDYSLEEFPTKDEWAASSGLLNESEFQIGSTSINSFSNNEAYLYNPGSFECDFELTIPFNGGSIPSMKITVEGETHLSLDKINALNGDKAIKIISSSELIIGIDELGRSTGNIYNNKILSGSFFKIPKCNKTNNIKKMYCRNIEDEAPQIPMRNAELKYRYIYL